ncbi:Extracellular_nuclease [Hexamita inflata]|uniref:Extracellular nuclease n=1 Tax=Hexamita inflata TaxID=28002 RepID=A0AA86NJD8_9EUKA|nr:Extracellular nuclease [Hexamita inflata]
MLTLVNLHLSEPLYPGKFGLELRQLLQKYSSKSQKTLGYQRAREEIYSYVQRPNRSGRVLRLFRFQDALRVQFNGHRLQRRFKLRAHRSAVFLQQAGPDGVRYTPPENRLVESEQWALKLPLQALERNQRDVLRPKFHSDMAARNKYDKNNIGLINQYEFVYYIYIKIIFLFVVCVFLFDF